MSRVTKPIAVAITAAVVLSGCAETLSVFRRDPAPERNGFDARAVAWSKKNGANTIAGTAELTANGKIKTCAGLEVRLVPDARYTRERISMLYGTATEGFVDADRARQVQSRPGAAVDPAYARSHKVSTCDPKGEFSFKQLADGTYYVLAPIVWRKADAQSTEGAFLMQRVSVKGGETRQLHMTPATRVSSR